MTFEGVEMKLFESFCLNHPILNWEDKLTYPGYYAIWIKHFETLENSFKQELLKRTTNLLYIGIAEFSLTARLFEQELQHNRPATFFRVIGAILGYRPEKGGLIGMRNKNNYRFCKVDTLSIREWIDKNIAVSIQTASRVENGIEKSLIKKYTPILNWTHNPNKFEPLKLLRKECRMIALKN